MKRRIIGLFAAVLLALSMLAGPAMAEVKKPIPKDPIHPTDCVSAIELAVANGKPLLKNVGECPIIKKK